MSDSEVDYLQPGFDASTLTNPRLRSILVTYNVHYASNAKKHELVELFNSNVAPQASKILARRARAKRSSMGIVDVGGVAVEEPDFEPEPERRKVSRKRTQTPAPAPEQDPEPLQQDEAYGARRPRRSSPQKRQARSTSYQSAEQPTPARTPAPVRAPTIATSDTDTGPDVGSTIGTRSARSSMRPPSRRARTKTPQVKQESFDEGRLPYMAPSTITRPHHRTSSGEDHDRDSSTFTDENPFQSGSSPLAAPASFSTKASLRRKTAETESFGSSTTAFAASPRKRASDSLASLSSTTDTLTRSSQTPRPASYSYRYTSSKSGRSPSIKAESSEPEPAYSDEEEEEKEEAEVIDPLLPGEEFTPEEQLELAQEEAAARRAGKLKKRSSSSQRASSSSSKKFLSALGTPLLVLSLTLLGAYGAWYRQEKIAVGYCGLGRTAEPLLAGQLDRLMDRLPDWVPYQVTDWVHSLEVPPQLQSLVEPQCEVCPSHAICYSDFSVRCESGYLQKPHPLALGGLIPLPPTCEPDGERARRIKAVADKAVEELRDRRAKWECGDLVDDEGQTPESPAIDVPVLRSLIGDKRSKKMSKDEFDDLWTAAIGEIESREEVEVETVYPTADSGAVSNRLSSTSLARLPLTCAIRRSVRLGLARHRFPLSALILSALAAVYMRSRFRARRAVMARVPALVDLVLERLATQKELWLYEDGGGAGAQDNSDEDSSQPDPFLFLPQLRDDVLRSTHSLKARERIWQHVRKVVELNSNVRTGQREGRNGEVGRAWEWIGPIGGSGAAGAGSVGAGTNFGDSGAVRRRRSGRVSWGAGATPAITTPTPAPLAAAAAAQDPAPRQGGPKDSRSALHKRWEESRPIY